MRKPDVRSRIAIKLVVYNDLANGFLKLRSLARPKANRSRRADIGTPQRSEFLSESVRVGVFFDAEDEKSIHITAVKHRREAYP